MMDLWSFFATCIQSSVMVRIWLILPGDPSSEAEESTESESMIIICAVEDSIVERILSKSESVMMVILPLLTQSLFARLAICPRFSSHEI